VLSIFSMPYWHGVAHLSNEQLAAFTQGMYTYSTKGKIIFQWLNT
jgi:hypothetical protein